MSTPCCLSRFLQKPECESFSNSSYQMVTEALNQPDHFDHWVCVALLPEREAYISETKFRIQPPHNAFLFFLCPAYG